MNGFFSDVLNYHEMGSGLNMERVLLCLLTAFVLGHVIAWVYIRTHRGVTYSATMSHSLIVLALIVSLVMLVVGNNVARAFGLFGALALIRFRTPVKDSKDTVYLFLSVALGISVGTGNYAAALVGTTLISAVLLYLGAAGFGNKMNHDGLFRLCLPIGGDHEARLRKLLARYCDHFRLVHIREVEEEGVMELSFQVTLFDSKFTGHLVNEVEGIDGVSRMSMLLQEGESTP